MSRNRRITLSAIAGALCTLAALPAVGQANVVVGPSPLTFPERLVGSTSDPQAVTVTVICNSFNPMTVQCTSFDTFTRNPQFSGDHPGDFSSEGGTCPASLTLTNAPVAQCTILVRFKPTASGARKALFLAGSSTSGGPNPIVVQGSAVPTGERAAALAKCKKKKTKKKRRKCRARANQLPE